MDLVERSQRVGAVLLGDRLLADVVGPPRRLRPDEVDEHLRRIEAL